MRFCDFINTLYDNLPCASKDRFALEIFSALCGETDPQGANKKPPFSNALPEGLSGDDGTYRKRLYNGNNKKYKGLSSRIKEHILEHQNKTTFVNYCALTIAENGDTKIREEFGVVTKASKEALFVALFDQFVEFAKCVSDDVTNLIPEKANAYLSEKTNETPQATTPLYPNDDFIATDSKPVRVTPYSKPKSYWIITNKGSVTWQGRYLEVVSQQIKGVRAVSTRVDIPMLHPKEYVKIDVEYDARYFDGDWEIVWEIKDISGRICFPNKNGLRQTISVVSLSPNDILSLRGSDVTPTAND